MHDTCFSCCACSFSCSALATTTACFAAVSTRLSPLYPSATVVAVALSLVCSALRLSTCAGDMRRRWSLAWHQKAKEVASRDPPPPPRGVMSSGWGSEWRVCAIPPESFSTPEEIGLYLGKGEDVSLLDGCDARRQQLRGGALDAGQLRLRRGKETCVRGHRVLGAFDACLTL